jgi:multicomponent Na+:H+ antiporter subunit E
VSERVLRSLPLVIVLLGVWLLLQGELSVGNVLGGAVLAVVLAVVFPVSDRAAAHRLHPWAFVTFIGFVLYSLVLSSWAVIKVIIRPTPTSLRSGIVRVGLVEDSPLTTTIVANAVTLTPGTMTLTARVAPAELHIHVLGIDDPDVFRTSVHDLERRTVAGLTPCRARGSEPSGPAPDEQGSNT